MLQRLVNEIIADAKTKDCVGCLLVIETEAFPAINPSEFQAEVISLKEWEISAPSYAARYENPKIHIVLRKNIFQKAGVDQNGYFLYKDELWRAMPHLGCAAQRNGVSNCCSFDEGLHDEDWITADELTPIANEAVATLIMANLDYLISFDADKTAETVPC